MKRTLAMHGPAAHLAALGVVLRAPARRNGTTLKQCANGILANHVSDHESVAELLICADAPS